MDDSSSVTRLSISSLLCQETENCLDEQLVDEDTYNLSDYSSSAGEDDEYVQSLMNREIDVRFSSGESSNRVIGNWIECARSNAIAWILRTRALFRFRFQTAYLSVTYFDRFLSNRTIDSEKYWAIRLLSMACLSLAAKMEECKVPGLSEFPVEEYSFEIRVIQRMEVLVLNTLNWNMSSITPFDYIHHFVAKLCNDSLPKKTLVSRAVDLILAMMRDLNSMMDFRPSVIGMAATLVALDQTLTRQTLEFQINAFFSNGFFKIEDVFDCYNRMQELKMESFKIPNYVLSSGLSPNKLRKGDIFEKSSAICGVGTKRKRLAFSNYDEDFVTGEEKRKI